MRKLPSRSVEVMYFLPVRVLAALTLTPGSGTLPDLTVPVISPKAEVVRAGVAWVVVGAGAAGCDRWIAGASDVVPGAGDAGVCATTDPAAIRKTTNHRGHKETPRKSIHRVNGIQAKALGSPKSLIFA